MKIWVPKFKILEPKCAPIISTGVKGRFRLAAIRHDGLCRETDWFDNLVLDAGVDRHGTDSDTHSVCAVGTGTTAPTVADTQLEVFLASTTTAPSTVEATLADSPYGVWKTITFEFGAGVAQGNLTEVGIGWAAAALYSRALIEDAGGAPTTFTVQADEILRVTYELTAYPPLADAAGTVDISGVTHDFVLRPRSVNNSGAWRMSTLSTRTFYLGRGGSASSSHRAYDGAIGLITEGPSGNSGFSNGRASATYTPGTNFRDYSVIWGLDHGNLPGGISAVSTEAAESGSGARQEFQCSYSPAIAKDATKVLTLNFRHSVARAP